MLKILIIVFFVGVCFAGPCVNKHPTYGTVLELDNGNISYSCNRGFELFGPQITQCDSMAKKVDRKAVCSPIMTPGGNNCSTYGVCPDDFAYMDKFTFLNVKDEIGMTKEEFDEVKEKERLLDLDVTSRTVPLDPNKFCRKCNMTPRDCCKFKKKKRRACLKCFQKTSSCRVQFWG